MKKSSWITFSVPLILLAIFVFFAKHEDSEDGPSIAEDADHPTSLVEKSASGKPSDEEEPSITSEPSAAPIKPAQRILDGAFTVKRIDDAEWKEIQEESGISIAPRRKFIVNSMPVRVDFAPLTAARERAVDRLQFDLGTGEPVVAEIGQRFEHGPDAYSFGGKLDGDPESEFSLSVYDDAVVATFTSGDFGIRQLRYAGEGVHKIDEIDDSLAPGCANETEHGLAAAQPSDPGREIAQISPVDLNADGLDDGSESDDTQPSKSPLPSGAEPQAAGPNGETELDVLIVYTPSTVTNEGSLNALLALINQGIVDTNLAFESSGIDAILRLVGTVETQYSGTDGSAALSAIRSTSDGVMDEIHGLRNSYGADFVSLWTPLSGVCGIASLITTLNTSQDYRAFGVTDPDCQYKYTFTHELGHNWGCMHAVGDSGAERGRGIYDYSHGWRWYGTNGTQYRSLMAYSPGTRVRQFSDPGVLYQGTASGRANLEDNAQTIEITKDVMSQFRSTTVDDHGDDLLTATTVATNSVTSGTLENSADLDFFKITLVNSDEVTFETTGTTDTTGQLLSSGGTILTSDFSSGIGSNFSITRLLNPGTYYIRVTPGSGNSGSYSLSISDGGGDDHSNSISGATVVPVPGSSNGNLEIGGDEDFFRLNVPAAGTLVVQSTGSIDTYGYLLNSAGTTLVSDDDDGASLNFLVSRLVDPGTYYVRLRGYSSSTTGSYGLSIAFTETPDDHANGFTEATVVTPGTIAFPATVPGEFEVAGDVDMLRFTLFGTGSDEQGDTDAAEVVDVVLDMEVTGSIPYHEEGFTMQPREGGSLTRSRNTYPLGSESFLADNGGYYFRLLSGSSLEITNDNNELFDAITVDLAEYSHVFKDRPLDVTWTGYKPDGSTVSHTFTTDGVIDGAQGAVDFENFTFPASFTGLTKLETLTPICSIDNIALRTGGTVIPTGNLHITSTGSTDTVGTLYNSSFSEITSDDNSGTGSNFQITESNFPTGTYYLRLNEFGNNGTGSYAVEIGYGQQAAAPVTPSGFTATQDNATAVNLSWDGVSNATSYFVYRNTSNVFSSATMIVETDSGTSYSDSSGNAGQSYFYWVSASNSTGESPASTSVIGIKAYPPPTITEQPTSTAVPSGSSVTLTVAASTTIGTLEYQWYAGSTGNVTTPVGGNSNTYSTPNLSTTQNYWVRVGNGFNQIDSASATISIQLEAPSLVTASQGRSATSILLRWLEVPGNASYSIYRSLTNDSGSAVKIGTSTSASFEDTTALAGQTYYYFVAATDSSGIEGVSSSGNGNQGTLSDTPIDGTRLPIGNVADFTYSPDGSHFYVSDDSGWLDQYSTDDKSLQSWAGVGAPLLGIDSNGSAVVGAASDSVVGHGVLHHVDFSTSIPIVENHPVVLEAGETGLFDAGFGSGNLALFTSRTTGADVPLREIDLSDGSYRTRPDTPTSTARVGSGTLIAKTPTGPITAGGPALYQNNFDQGSASLDDFLIHANNLAGVENGKLRLNSTTTQTSVSLHLQDVAPSFNPRLSGNTGLMTWAFNLSNEDGNFNNQFSFKICNESDLFRSSSFGYLFRGGGYVGNRMILSRIANYQSIHGNVNEFLIDETTGLQPGSEGAFRITFDPATGEWRVYFSQGSIQNDPLTEATLFGSVTDTGFALESLPWIAFGSRTTGSVYIDNFTFSIEGSPNPPSSNENLISIVQTSPANAGWFAYDLETDTFGAEIPNPNPVLFAATSPRDDFIALADGTQTRVSDLEGNPVATLPHSGGVAFSPTANHLYLADAGSDLLRVYSTTTWQEIASTPIPGGLSENTEHFGQGRMEVRPDGEELALACEDGIRFIDLLPLINGFLPDVSPAVERTLTGTPGGPNDGLSQTYTVTNNSSFPMNWTASDDAPWLDLAPTSGTLDPGESQSVVATTNGGANVLPLGTTGAILDFANADTTESLTRTLNMEVATMTQLPVYEGFENALADWWSYTRDGVATPANIASTGGYSGNGQIEMAAPFDSQYTHNALTIALDLTGASGVQVLFQAKEFGDELNSPPNSPFPGDTAFDGVSISEDGENWYAALTFDSSFSSYRQYIIDLDNTIAAHGLSYGRNFRIRFNQYDNFRIPSDGIAIDSIEITTAADRTVPGDIEVTHSGSEITQGSLLDFGATTIGTEEVISIRNRGSGVLIGISHPVGNLGFPTQFNLQSSIEARLLPGESGYFTLTPSDLGQLNGMIEIRSSDPNDDPYSFSVRATGADSILSWRVRHFGTSSDTGSGGDLANPDGDLFNNTEEFAYGLDPNEENLSPLWIESVNETEVIARYTRNSSAAANGISIQAQWSDDLSTGSWSPAGITESVTSTLDGISTMRLVVPTEGYSPRFIRIEISK